MLFQADITIPKNTAETNATIALLRIRKGIITKIMVRPRPGHASLAHLVILHHEKQIAPSTINMDFHGDTFPIDWEEFYEVKQPPFILKLRGWNNDDTYSHTFDVFVALLEKRHTLAFALANAISNLAGILSPRRLFTGGK